MQQEAPARAGRGRRRRTPVAIALGAIVVTVGVVLVLLGMHSNAPAQPDAASGAASSAQPVAGAAAQPIAAGASQPAAGAAMPGKTTPPKAQAGSQTLPPAAGGGDHYVRNVTAGAICSPAGARGFTTHGKVVRCATTTSDAKLRWRE